MARTLRMLHVEDSEQDEALLRRHLIRAGYELHSERVETAETMLTALTSRKWDVILCDYAMPRFNALAALSLLKQTKLDIPLIIISGTVGEAAAVEAMRSGANDYLMKDNLTRLTVAIERELHEAENRRARQVAEEEKANLIAELQGQRARLDNIISTVPGVVWEAWGQPDAGTQRVDFVSDYVETMLGYTVEEWLSTPNFWLTVAHPDDREAAARAAAEAFAACRSGRQEIRWVTKDGRSIQVESNYAVVKDEHGQPVGLRGVTIDITERRQAEKALRESEEQLRQSQKMEAIGLLAGGVAHDFNNLLTAITGYCSLALRRIDEDHPIRNYLQEIKKAGDRAASLTRQLLAFGRKQILQPVALNLNDVVTDLNKMLCRLIGEDIKVVTKFDPTLKTIKADRGQIEQVIVNLVVNARDAMPHGGTLTIETFHFVADRQYASRHLDIEPGNYVALAVSDTGLGMDEHTKSRIFEPFFTTKEQGKGTGLGLSTVYGIVKQSDGNIWVYSELDRGTVFKVYLPELVDYVEPAQKTVDELDEEAIGSETILLVEDEDVVRGLAQEILECAGYRVLATSGGAEAVRLCQQNHKQIDLLLTDVVMPEMSGTELAKHLTSLCPSLRVLFMSGYTDEAIVHHGIVDSSVQFVQKPFNPTTLIKRVRDVLDA